uniref:Uncharacterized protein n=2 Tax=Eutreptiella gymnastica TaxID=73025 RepID=A0A7S1J4F0_9EUGL|mmetsp:Transcript_66423/g.117933  ORF Transcript_66423/g.117933 Transcript_66423/m.117933 type:complete len:776 (+) Transcript_66423:191-2518(+)
MITYFKHFVGVEAKHNDGGLHKDWEQAYLLPFFTLNATQRNTLKVHIDDKVVYTAEELLGMYFAMLKEMAEKDSESKVTNCMITVPAGHTARQNQMIVEAAELANLNVLSLMHDTTAAALQYGVQQRGFKKPTTAVVFDMGSSKLEVGVFQFTPSLEDDGKKTKKMDSVGLGMLTVLAAESDMANGGRHYDVLLAREVAKKFSDKTGVDVLAMDNLAGDKAVAKLMRSAQKAKETLSANKDARVSVEGLWDERDFNTVVTRARFEELAAGLIDRAIGTFNRAIEKSGLKLEDIDSVELMGGGSRIPILQTRLKEAFGGRQLGRTLNTDEANALGATFHGARLSGAFRVRSFALAEHHRGNISFSLSADESNPNPAIRPLFLQSKYPSKKLITVYRTKNFNITIYDTQADPATGQVVHVPINQYELKGVVRTLNKMGLNKEYVHPKSKASIEIKFKLSDGGLVSLDSVVAKYAEVVNVTKRVKIDPLKKKVNATETNAEEKAEESKPDVPEETAAEKTHEKTEDTVQDKAEDKADKAETEQKAAEEQTKEETGNEMNEATKSAPAKENATKDEPAYETINTTKVVNHQDGVKFTTVYLQQPMPMNVSDILDATHTLNKWKERDLAKLKIAEARNSLEALIISTKYDGFFEDESLKEFYDEAEGASIMTALKEVEEWMEDGDGQDTSAEEYQKKIQYLTSLTAPVIKRKTDKEKQSSPDFVPGEEASAPPSEPSTAEESVESKAEGTDTAAAEGEAVAAETDEETGPPKPSNSGGEL